MHFHACIDTRGAGAHTKGGLVHGMAYGHRAITPRTLVASLAEVKSEYDQGSGQLSGKRTHSPLVITKETDSASPSLLQCLQTNEVLRSLVIKLIGRPPSGTGEHLHSTITLTNATISKVNRFGAAPSKHSGGVNTNELEQVSFTFQKITYTNVLGSASTSDDWMNPR